MNCTVHLSVVVPVYGCAASLCELCARLTSTLSELFESHEIILVNDGSTDGAWSVIRHLAETYPAVRGINLSRNFGQHYAITAGLDYARGNWVAVMDCDLQDQPEAIPALYAKATEGYDVVVGRRAIRHDKPLKVLLSRVFYAVFSYLAGIKIDPAIGNFGVYSRKAVRNICALREHNRSFGLFAIWVGFSRTEIDVPHSPRLHGLSSYTLKRLSRLAFDSIVAHSNSLLLLSVKAGACIGVVSFVAAAWLVVRYFLWATLTEGWTSLMVSVYFLSGLVMMSVGVAGLYIGKIFDEVKQRPLYIVDSTTFGEMKDNE